MRSQTTQLNIFDCRHESHCKGPSCEGTVPEGRSAGPFPPKSLQKIQYKSQPFDRPESGGNLVTRLEGNHTLPLHPRGAFNEGPSGFGNYSLRPELKFRTPLLLTNIESLPEMSSVDFVAEYCLSIKL